MQKAIIFNIMRYSIHDGPGIRTTVFFKGCPLLCKWCHNPEALSSEPQQTFNQKKCINCKPCLTTYKVNGQVNTGNVEIASCPTGARETIGYQITAAQLMQEITKDVLFYEQSGGGVTFSGGEPFSQAEFLMEILACCKKDYIHTAIDTCGYCDTESILKAAEITGCFLYDIKFIDSKKHEKYCGKPNELILKNLKCLSETKTKLLIRIPVIPSINDDLAEMAATFEFIKDFNNIETVHLLPYHNIHGDKYNRMEKQYELSDISKNESTNMPEIINIFGSRFKTKVGG